MAEPRVPASSRRTLLACAGATCVAVLAGCARYNSNRGIGASQPAQGSSPATASTRPSGDSAGSPALAKTADIPVGGGKILTGPQIVITQPKAGSFLAFTAVCTHAGCTVSDVTGGTINCPCHGSKFSIVNGSVVNGPATSPLAAVSIKVRGTSIIRA